MHIQDQYGPVTSGVLDLALPGLSSPSDAWTQGTRQKELNERGAYIHRFSDQNSSSSMIAAVKKISEDNLCTPCTLVGPSLCRTYNHHVWEGCAALLFSPGMPAVLAYKGDIYSNRLSNAPHLNHNKFKSALRSRNTSLKNFSDAVRTTFNGYGPTGSAFKGRRTKQLNLVMSASHHAAKTREMEKRANVYFTPENNRLNYNVDVPSKDLILELSDRYQDFNLRSKPVLQTKAQVLSFIDAVTLAKPVLLPFLQAAKIKISNFKDDSVIPVYFNNAGTAVKKQPHERSYSEFLKWQFDNSQGGVNLHHFSDKSTTLTPNEVLGMPSSEDLVGLVIDPSTSRSFDQALDTLEHLKTAAKSHWHSVAGNVPPFTHLISHMDEGTILQLGWSKMIIPYSTKGLREYCATGTITGIDKYQFVPDYFLLLHWIASNSVLVFAKKHCVVDILCIKPNVIGNFADILCDNGDKLIYKAIEQASIHTATVQLFAHLDRLGAGNFRNTEIALLNPARTYTNSTVLTPLLAMNAQQIADDLDQLLSAQINRIERSVFNTPNTHRTIKYRGGFNDKGAFAFNPKLGSITLVEGVREYDNGVRMVGLFKQSGSMKHGGSELEYGISFENERVRFGNFEETAFPFSLSQKTSTQRNQQYFQLCLGEQPQAFNINFSKSDFVRFYFELKAVPGQEAVKVQLRNYDWPSDLDQVNKQPSRVLAMLGHTLQHVKHIPADQLPSAIVCVAALRCAAFKQQISASGMDALHSVRYPLHEDATRELELQFEQLREEAEVILRNLVNKYQYTDPRGHELCACLDRLPNGVGIEIRLYLVVVEGVTVQRLATPLAVAPSVIPFVPTPTPTVHPTSIAGKKKGLARLLHRIKIALKMK